MASVRDITERYRIERQLRQQQRLAAVGQLAGGIAHDFNNMLASVMLYGQMALRNPELPLGVGDALRTILEESQRGADLVQQILDFSRSAMMEVEPVSLASVIDEVCALLDRTIPEDIRVTVSGAGKPCIVRADPTRIHLSLIHI